MWHFGFTQPRGIAANDAGDRKTKKLGFNLSVLTGGGSKEGRGPRIRGPVTQRKSNSLPLLTAHLGGGEDPQRSRSKTPPPVV